MPKAPKAQSAVSDRRERRRVQFVCDFYVPEVHAGVVAYAQAAGWSLLDTTIYVPRSLFKYHEPSDGILAIYTQEELCAWLKEQSCPVVRLLCSVQASDFPAVEPDCERIGIQGAEHLLTLGAPTFVFYRVLETSETRRMWKGFSETVRRAGRQPHLLDFAASLPAPPDLTTPRSLRWQFLHKKLDAMRRPLAVMVEDDRFANDLFEAAAMGGWRIPEDIALLAADNRALVLGKYPIPLSSVDSNLHGIGWAGAELLERVLNGETPPKGATRITPGPVIARHSTATFACDNPAVSAAVKFLRARYQESIQVGDIARAAGLSPRSIQTAFRQTVGRTISDELFRLRLAHASRLLRETDLKLESVALESGLTSAKYLCDVFRAEFKFTPTQYRESQQAITARSPGGAKL